MRENPTSCANFPGNDHKTTARCPPNTNFLIKSISSIANGFGRDYLEWENLFASAMQQFDNDSPSIAMYS